MGRRRGTPGWRYARAALEDAAAERCGRQAHVGWASRCGDGLFRDLFAASVSTGPEDDAKILGKLVAAVPRSDAPHFEIADRVVREVELLTRLAGMDLEIRVPGWASAQRVGNRTVLVREVVCGFPMPMKVAELAAFDPLEIVAWVAATVHDIDPEPLRDVVPVNASRRDHALARVQEVEEIAGNPVADEALRWLREHLPREAPAAVVHGDLLGQNIILPLDGEPGLGLIDWEYCCIGDPAYDLAIVTRGGRKPFGRARGRELLVDAYLEAGGHVEVSTIDVAFHEMAMIAGWYLESLQGRGHGHPPETCLQRLRALLRRLPA